MSKQTGLWRNETSRLKRGVQIDFFKVIFCFVPWYTTINPSFGIICCLLFPCIEQANLRWWFQFFGVMFYPKTCGKDDDSHFDVCIFLFILVGLMTPTVTAICR